MSPFNTNFIVDYFNINPDLTVALPRLMSYIQEASLRHTEEAGYSMKWFSDRKEGFVLTHWQVEIEKYPEWNQEIKIKTWPVKLRGVLAERAFTVTDKKGNELALANSNWVYLDLNTRKPTRPIQEMLDSYGPQLPTALPKDLKLPPTDDFKTIDERMYFTTRKDIDTNLHVNNEKYIEWAIDCIPDDVYNHLSARQLKVAYKKECTQGKELLLETMKKTGGNNRREEFLTVIRDCHEPDTIFTEVWSCWR